MARGIIYVMTTVVPGLIKIGKTGLNNFDSRMSTLERNGYANITGLNGILRLQWTITMKKRLCWMRFSVKVV